MGRMTRKTKTRVENLVAWVLAGMFLVLTGAGAYWIGLQIGVI